MRLLFSLLLFTFSSLAARSIVFVHLGNSLPDYLPTAIAEARLFNPTCPIYLVANQRAVLGVQNRTLKPYDVNVVTAESLTQEPGHQEFKKKTRLDRTSRAGFWLYSTERFFYLHELMKEYNLSDVIHLESDVMLYADVDRLLPVLQKHYAGKIGATFDNNGRCIAGFFYVSDQNPIERFTRFVVEKIGSTNNDMQFLAEFKQCDGGQWIDHLPIVMPSYAEDRPLVSPHEHKGEPPEAYYNHFDEFLSIFDAAAIGQYLGGIDPRNAPLGPGFINESCVFIPSYCQYDWVVDEMGRRVPVAIYKNETYRINNLHIHCKNLKEFYSGAKL
jgi:hypothetical protein